jgi:cell division protein FtsB
MRLPEQTPLSPALFREDETTTPTAPRPDFATFHNTEFRQLQAENSNLKAEVEELKQNVSNLEIDVKSLQRVVFRGA